MTILVTLAFLLAVTGSFILLSLSPFTFLEGLAAYIRPQKTSMKSRIEKSRKNKQPKGLKLLFLETKEILRITGKSGMFAALCILSLILFVVGAMISLTMKNSYLVPVMAAGLALLPFYYVKLTAGRHKRQINTELETALSIITTSYLRGKNTIIRAIEENQPYLNPPVAEVFRNFLLQAKLINSNTKEALAGLKTGIDNAVFHEWVDEVIACQDDYNLKMTLPPIVAKLSDMRVVSAELDLLLFEPVKEYIAMVVLLLGSIPLMYFLNKDWYHTLMFTELGKVLLAICAGVIFLSVAAVAKHTRPIEYKR
ncbi:type II secretion system F family protein [Lacrimispora sp. 38-1]|uniref:type II secretion system F family protein n=1 Tax=Lacrimispora sp. 38-1 TaxID=3125778 RepID=UPI003CF2EBAF